MHFIPKTYNNDKHLYPFWFLSALSWGKCSNIFSLICYKIMFNLDKVHMILEEMIMNGHIVEGNKSRVLAPLIELEKVPK